MKKTKQTLIAAYWFASLAPFFANYDKISTLWVAIILTTAILNLANCGRLINNHMKAIEHEDTI